MSKIKNIYSDGSKNILTAINNILDVENLKWFIDRKDG